MKLELKHLAPYLPYKLEGIFLSDIHGIVLTLNDYWVKGETKLGNNVPVGVMYKSDSFKPILRPLSDLTKEIEVNGEKFAPFKWFNFINSDIDFETQIITLSNDVKWLDSTYYGIIEKLFEWHFDVFGLIEKGLAIDINTLQNGTD